MRFERKFYLTKKERLAYLLILVFWTVVLFIQKRNLTVLHYDEDYAAQSELRKVKGPRKKEVNKDTIDISEEEGFLKSTMPFMKSINPNNANEKELQALGYGPFVARNIMKYRSKGGKFKNIEDLRKIYGMTEEILSRSEPYLVFKEKKADRKLSAGNKLGSVVKRHVRADSLVRKRKVPRIDINSVDVDEWKKLPGISPWLARRIVRYSELLGGFGLKEQLKEVYQLNDSIYNVIKEYLYLNKKIESLRINEATFKELLRHPYLDKNDVRAIMKYRKMHGPVLDSAKFYGLYAVDTETKDRIFPYLDFGRQRPYSSTSTGIDSLSNK